MQARSATILVDFTATALAEQLQNEPGLAILEHPEDLGKVGKDVPGSIWQFESIKGLGSQADVVTGAIRQCDFGTTYQKPTRLLGRLPGLGQHMHEGWPTFDAEGSYTGPLPKFSGTATRLIGRQGSGFRTSDTAAWPEKLCDLLAGLAVATVRIPAQASALASGVGSGSCAKKDVTEECERLSQPTVPDMFGEVDGSDGRHTHTEPRGAPRRRRISQEELLLLAGGGRLKDYEVYVGRGGRGLPPSRWGNPFKIGPSCTRREAIRKFQGHFKDQKLFNEIGEIVGKDLLRHCRPEEECHGDYLLAMAHHGVRQEEPSMAGFIDDGLPVRINSPKPPDVPRPF